MTQWGNLNCAIVGFCGALLLGTPGQAQDAWEGAFFGAHVGYAESDLDWALNGNGWWGVANPAANRTSFSMDGEVYGVHLGYSWVSHRQLYTAVEVSYNQANFRSTQASPAFPAIDVWTVEVNDYWDLTTKLGKAYEKYMFYGSFGLAVADTNTTATPPVDASSGNSFGYTIGLGGAYMVSDSVSLGLEYKYYDFGTEQHSFNPACGPCNVSDGRNIDLTSHVINLRLTKHF